MLSRRLAASGCGFVRLLGQLDQLPLGEVVVARTNAALTGRSRDLQAER